MSYFRENGQPGEGFLSILAFVNNFPQWSPETHSAFVTDSPSDYRNSVQWRLNSSLDWYHAFAFLANRDVLPGLTAGDYTDIFYSAYHGFSETVDRGLSLRTRSLSKETRWQMFRACIKALGAGCTAPLKYQRSPPLILEIT